MPKVSSGGSLEKSRPADVSYVQAFSPLEPERLVRSRRVNVGSMRRNGGKTMVPVADRSVARGTRHVRSRKSLPIFFFVRPAHQTSGRIRFNHRRPVVTMGGQVQLEGQRRSRPLYTCDRHVARDLTLVHFAQERLDR